MANSFYGPVDQARHFIRVEYQQFSELARVRGVPRDAEFWSEMGVVPVRLERLRYVLKLAFRAKEAGLDRSPKQRAQVARLNRRKK